MTRPTTIAVSRAVLEVEDLGPALSVTQLRGYIGNLFVDDPEFHHHSQKSYHYPLVQYKRVDGKLMVVGLQEYAKVLFEKLAGLEHVTTPRGVVKVRALDFQMDDFVVDSVTHSYEFATPWIALNEDNYARFRNMSEGSRTPFLERLLVGNTLSTLKWLGIFVTHRVAASISSIRPVSVTVHGNMFEGFRARFSLNVGLPDYVGLGKSVSKGFGSIRRI